MKYKVQERLFKVIIIGDPTVGKTSMVNRYVNNTFKRDYKGTIGVDFSLKNLHWTETETVKLQLWDIAGQERFTKMTRVYYKDTHACVIMFDLTNKQTMANAAKWKNDLDSKCCLPDGSPVPSILLANKCDLPYRKMEREEIEKFAKENNFFMWSEVSVKENFMISEAMRILVERLLAKYFPEDEDDGDDDDVVRVDDKSHSSTKAMCQC